MIHGTIVTFIANMFTVWYTIWRAVYEFSTRTSYGALHFLTFVAKIHFFTMGKVKNTSEEKGKKKRSPQKQKFKYRTYVNRICKSLSIPKVNKDASQFMDNAVQSIIDGCIRQFSVMLANTNRTLNHKSAKLGFVGYMEALGAPENLIKKAISKSEVAVATLGSSQESAPKKKTKKWKGLVLD